MFLGENFLEWLLLALGGAMTIGNLIALVRPPSRPRAVDLTRPPLGRSLIYIALGVVVVIWALASLVS